MRDMNSIILEGNLTRDPEYRETPKGTPVCMFSVASNRYYKVDDEPRQEVSFFNVETWAKVAESCNEYLKKGRGVRVVGRLKQDRWVNQEGKNCDRIKIVAEHVDFKPMFKKTQDADAAEAADGESVDVAAESPDSAEEGTKFDELTAARGEGTEESKDDELLEAV